MDYYAAVLFDMDGVIIDTQAAVTRFWQDIARMYDVDLTDSDFIQHIYGCPALHTLSTLFSHLNAQDRDAVLGKMAGIEARMTYTAVDGAIGLLDQLHRQAIPTALVTSADPWKVNAVFSQLPLGGMFTVQVMGTDIERGKPNPDCYLRAAELLYTRPDRCIVFEDAISGVKAATAAGALCIGVQQPEMATALIGAGAACVVADLEQVVLREQAAQSHGGKCGLQVGLSCDLCVLLHGSS